MGGHGVVVPGYPTPTRAEIDAARRFEIDASTFEQAFGQGERVPTGSWTRVANRVEADRLANRLFQLDSSREAEVLQARDGRFYVSQGHAGGSERTTCARALGVRDVELVPVEHFHNALPLAERSGYPAAFDERLRAVGGQEDFRTLLDCASELGEPIEGVVSFDYDDGTRGTTELWVDPRPGVRFRCGFRIENGRFMNQQGYFESPVAVGLHLQNVRAGSSLSYVPAGAEHVPPQSGDTTLFEAIDEENHHPIDLRQVLEEGPRPGSVGSAVEPRAGLVTETVAREAEIHPAPRANPAGGAFRGAVGLGVNVGVVVFARRWFRYTERLAMERVTRAADSDVRARARDGIGEAQALLRARPSAVRFWVVGRMRFSRTGPTDSDSYAGDWSYEILDQRFSDTPTARHTGHWQARVRQFQHVDPVGVRIDAGMPPHEDGGDRLVTIVEQTFAIPVDAQQIANSMVPRVFDPSMPGDGTTAAAGVASQDATAPHESAPAPQPTPNVAPTYSDAGVPNAARSSEKSTIQPHEQAADPTQAAQHSGDPSSETQHSTSPTFDAAPDGNDLPQTNREQPDAQAPPSVPATTEPVQPETGTRPDDARAADTENQPFPDSEHAQSGEGAAEDPSSSLNVDPPPQQPDAVDETPLSAEELADQKELLNLAHSLEQAESKTPSAPSNQSPPAAGGEPREVITLGDLASRAGQGDIYTPADKLIGSTSPLHEANAGQADAQTGIDSAPLSPDEIATQQELLGLAHSLEQAEGTPGGPGSGPPDGTGSEGSSTPDLAEIADQPAPAASDDLQSLLGLAHALEQDEGMVPLDHAPGLTTDNNDFHAAFDPSEPLDDASWQANSLAAEQAGDEGQGAHDVTPGPGEFNSDGSDVAIFDGGFDGGADQPDNFGHY